MNLNRSEGHLIAAAIRVLAHRDGRPPEPREVAELLNMPEATVRLQVAQLAELGAVVLVESAYATHLQVTDIMCLEELPAEVDADIAADLADFDKRKQEEAEKMAHLFEDGDHDKRRAQKHGKMEQDLFDFQKNKKKSPFSEDM